MAKFLFVYSGGTMPTTEEENKQQLEDWTVWYSKLGSKMVDMGFPLKSESKMTDGQRIAGGTMGLTGYSIVEANNIDHAMEFARECPVHKVGATVEVYEQMEMPGM